MNALLSTAEMNKEFASEWILIADPETDESHSVQAGRVVLHSKNRDDVYREAAKRRLERFAILYTGSLPDDAAIVL